jgi:hypothetical protein
VENNIIMPVNLKVISVSLVIVFIALFVFFYVLESMIRIMGDWASLPVIVLMFIIMAAALTLVVNITADTLS